LSQPHFDLGLTIQISDSVRLFIQVMEGLDNRIMMERKKY